MKYLVLVCDGMADEPIDSLGGKTPLQVAKTPYMDALAKRGIVGRAAFTPEGMYPGSDIANMAILGYDPKKYHTGRAPLEAANMGIFLEPHEVAFRCNLVTVADGSLRDFSAGHISSQESHILVEALNAGLASDAVRFHPGVGYRHIAVFRDAALAEDLLKSECMPPHDLIGKRYAGALPSGPAAGVLRDLMDRSRPILENHDINKVRVDLGENPGNMIWLWGQGGSPHLPPFQEKYRRRGAMISAVDLLNGIGRLVGLEVIQVPGATGYYDTNFVGKAEYGLKALERLDFVFIHVEAADEAGHNGDLAEKIRAIENFDSQVVGTVVNFLGRKSDHRILICPDHPTPVALRTHTNTPVLFLIAGKGVEPSGAAVFDEPTAGESKLSYAHGHALMGDFLDAPALSLSGVAP
jgi:2,3-bisphosphoglycerate-independent phosphoglycerate mutase